MSSAGKRVAVVAGLALLFAVSVVATQRLFTSVAPGGNDFYPRWKGAQLFWRDGIDPYSDKTSLAIQRDVYGKPAEPDQDQLLFVYPFYTVFLLLPLVWLPLSYSWIQAIWMVGLQFALIASILFLLRLIEWRMPAWLLGLTLLWTLIFYNSARTLILGQFTALIFLFLVTALYALKQQRDLLAGVLMALTTIKPQLTLLLIPALFLWATGQRRYRFIAGFLLAMVCLAAASFLLLPGWLSSFIDQVRSYPAYTVTPPPLWVITSYYFPVLGKPVETLMSILLLLFLALEWRHLLHLDAGSDRFFVIIGLTLVITNMIIVRTATTNYIVLYIPLFWGLRRASVRYSYGNLLIMLIYLLSIVAMWTLFLATVQGDFEHPVMYLPLPLLLLISLVWATTKVPSRPPARSTVRAG